MQKDFFYQEIKAEYLPADFDFKTGKITVREFSEKQFEIYSKLLAVYETLNPHISNLQKDADENWNKIILASKGTKAVAKTLSSESNNMITDIKNTFLTADLKFRMQNLSITSYHKTINLVLIKLLDSVNQIQPYFNEFQKAAEDQWQQLQ